ncbi:DUF4255 domain-containing protein [Glaciecola sp. 1036]|uniref:DUF4255 domain-containing protein n=1 Tax=Alteromonadaceae TaxID=72275 RepID=UPI003CFC2410
MLDSVLMFVMNELNGYLKSKSALTDDVVKLGPIVDDSGKYALDKNSISLSLINVEQEAITKQQLPKTTYSQGKMLTFAPELRVNLYVIFAARFDIYDQALKYMSHIMNFFQTRPLFTPDTYPELDTTLSRISLDLQSPNYDQLNQIWAFIGGKQLPSVYYKIRVVSLRDQESPNIGPPILTVNNEIHSK